MKIEETVNRNIKVVVIAAVVIIALPLLYSMVCFAFSTGTQSQGKAPLLQKAAGDKPCVKDKTWMRYNHWQHLYEMRDMAMRDGKDPKHGFADCRGCHTERKQFCDKCHNVVNFYPDCFGCHYYP